MTASPKRPHPAQAVRYLAVMGLCLVVIAGVALTQRGPDIQSNGAMQERPVIGPEGSTLYVQRYEVSIAQWNSCVTQGGCALEVHARAGHDPVTTPATGLSYVDAQEYLSWINSVSDRDFRLPTASEWAHMARSVLPQEEEPIFTDPSLTWASTYLTIETSSRALRAQGSFSTSPDGISDLDGSVWEWTEECYAGAGDGVQVARCPAFFVGGEHLAAMSYLIRDPARGGCAAGIPPAHLGMRLVSDKPG